MLLQSQANKLFGDVSPLMLVLSRPAMELVLAIAPFARKRSSMMETIFDQDRRKVDPLAIEHNASSFAVAKTLLRLPTQHRDVDSDGD